MKFLYTVQGDDRTFGKSVMLPGLPQEPADLAALAEELAMDYVTERDGVIPEGKPVIFCIGEIWKWKWIDIIVENHPRPVFKARMVDNVPREYTLKVVEKDECIACENA